VRWGVKQDSADKIGERIPHEWDELRRADEGMEKIS